MSPDSPAGVIISPVARAIRDVGLPAVVIIFLLVVLTGLLPTPLMDSIISIDKVVADMEDARGVAEMQLQVAIITCQLIATDKTEASKCIPSK